MLIEFASVVDAVRCAVVVQQGMEDRNANIPEDQRIRFRIGINLGDIIIDEGDIFGDGVNVAARLEAGLGTGRDTELQRAVRARGYVFWRRLTIFQRACPYRGARRQTVLRGEGRRVRRSGSHRR